MTNCTSIDIRDIDTSQCTSISMLFDGCESLIEILGIEDLDVS